ncbi:MAG: cellulose binding domain-containing protein [Myxococcota bacterium]
MPRQRKDLFVTKLASFLMAGSGLLVASCQDPSGQALALDEDTDEPTDEAELDERQRLSQSGLYLVDPAAAAAAPANADQLVDAIDLPGQFLRSSTLQGDDVSVAMFEQWGVIEPRRGDSLAVLSTGVIGTTPEPGTDMGGGGAAGDVVTLEVGLEIPEGFNRLSFDFNFLSAESPDFVGSVYNDTFTATLVDPDGMAHEIASASVNLAEENPHYFFDVSAALAGGTHFDIFTEDPSGVDSQFDAGGALPDAGITGFQTVEYDLPSTGSWTLVFEIRDLGDGLFDSAVVLDNLRIQAMEHLSLNPPEPSSTEPQLVLADGSLVSDIELLRQAGERIRGVVADGVTQILLRTRLPGPGSVEYALEGGTFPQDGGVGALNAAPGDTVIVNSIETAAGEYYAVAAYTAPVDFDRGTDGDLTTRPVNIRASYTPTDPLDSPFQDVQELTIHRPPVVLVHGLWGDTKVQFDWQMSLIEDPRFSVHEVDYDSTAPLTDPASLGAIAGAIVDVRAAQDAQGIAGAQVDLVAHGSGGLLARLHLDDENNLVPENFEQGFVHKFITLNTPHLGSDFATAGIAALGWAEENRNAFTVNNIFNSLAATGTPVPSGASALADMQVGQPIFDDLLATTVPSHAIVGSGGLSIPNTPVPGNNNPAWSSTERVFLYNHIQSYHPDLFGASGLARRDFVFGPSSQVFSEQHDMVSEVSSQAGGLDLMAVSAMTTFDSHFTSLGDNNLESVTYRVPGSTLYSDRIIELLGTPVGSAEFGLFPAPGGLAPLAPPPPPAAPAAGPVALSVESYGLTILSPTDGFTVTPGGSVEVSVGLDVAEQITELFVVSRYSVEFLVSPTFPVVLDMPVPLEVSGDLGIQAFGFTASGDFLSSEGIDLGATPDAVLLSLHILNRNPYLFGVGDTRSVDVVGLYDDGIERGLTSASAGTEYISSDPTVFTVSSDGVLTATGDGKATLVARNGTVQDSVTVDVRPGILAGFEVTTEWNGGYCVTLRVTNNTPRPTSDWSVDVDLAGATITESWNGVLSADTGTITVDPEHDWQHIIPAGLTKGYTGFCAALPPGGSDLPTVVSTTATF